MFFSLFLAVIRTLEVISEGGDTGWNQDSRRSADILLICITTKFQFIAFVVTNSALNTSRVLLYPFKRELRIFAKHIVK